MQEFTYSGTELEALAEADNYYSWIVEQFRPWLRGDVAEVGAGIGTFAQRLAAEPSVERLHLFEPDPGMGVELERRFAGNDRIEVVHGVFDGSAVSGMSDAIVLVNVLEHIADDRAFVQQAHASLRPGGALLLFTPALPWLYGSLDRAFEHHRRYTRAAMRALLQGSGFEVARLRYVNLPGIVSWLLAGRVFGLQTINPASMRMYDRWVIPPVAMVERRLPPPVGQNLLAVGVRPR